MNVLDTIKCQQEYVCSVDNCIIKYRNTSCFKPNIFDIMDEESLPFIYPKLELKKKRLSYCIECKTFRSAYE